VPAYSDEEYQRHLQSETWTKAETDHLMDLARRFDLRFIVMKDRWDRERFSDRSVEDLKERYYNVLTTYNKVMLSPYFLQILFKDHVIALLLLCRQLVPQQLMLNPMYLMLIMRREGKNN